MSIAEFFNELDTAEYEPVTDKIIGCKEGSIIWWHERGHQEQWKKGIGQKIQWIQQMILLISIAILCVLAFTGEQSELPLIFFLLYLICWLSLEMDAWVYALKNKVIK